MRIRYLKHVTAEKQCFASSWHIAPLLLLVFFCLCVNLRAQTAKTSATSATSTIEEVKIYQEAMSWFSKGQDMIGTDMENSDEQAEMFQKAAVIRPEFIEARYNLGLIYMNRNQMQEAAGEFEAVLRIEPDFDSGIYSLLGAAHHAAGNFEEAIAAFENGLRQKPEDMMLLKALGYLQFHTNRDDAATATLQRVITADPDDVTARIDLALLYHRKDEIEKAAAEYQRALLVDPEIFTARYNLGLIYARQQKIAEAAEELDRARAIKPGDAELLELLGDMRTHLGQYVPAADAYQAALNQPGDAKFLLTKLGFSLAAAGRIPAAIATLREAVALDAKNPDSWLLLGDLYHDSGKPEEAVDAYRKSLELRPDRKEARLNLGIIYAEKEMYAEAMTELRQAAALDPDYASTWNNIALVAEKLEDDKEAIAAHEKLIALGRGAAYNHFHLGVLYAKTDLPDQSIDAFARAIELEPERYREVLKEELKNVRSVLDNVRFKKRFTDLLTTE